jgi:hypothetical protein
MIVEFNYRITVHLHCMYWVVTFSVGVGRWVSSTSLKNVSVFSNGIKF